MPCSSQTLDAVRVIVGKEYEEDEAEVVADFLVEIAERWWEEGFGVFRERVVEEDPDVDQVMAKNVFDLVAGEQRKAAREKKEVVVKEEEEEKVEPAPAPLPTLPQPSLISALSEADSWLRSNTTTAFPQSNIPQDADDPFPDSVWCPHWEVTPISTADTSFLPFCGEASKPKAPGVTPHKHSVEFRKMERAGREAGERLKKELNRRFNNAATAEVKAEEYSNTAVGVGAGSAILPVDGLKEEFLSVLKTTRVLVVEGETGCGKTTGLPRFLIEAGYKSVVISQPRRVAAVEAARYMAGVMGGGLGGLVGYSVRFGDCSTRRVTRIKYVTDGVLVRELMVNKDLKGYSVVMIDEAHERTTSTDLLFALLKPLLTLRTDLKLIIATATLDRLKFLTYFTPAPLLSIPGRTHPYEIYHSKQIPDSYPHEAVSTAVDIHNEAGDASGDILVFLTGTDEIDWAVGAFNERVQNSCDNKNAVGVALYGSMSLEQQKIALSKGGKARKAVFSTNVAEASLTLPGVVFVVDTGFVKQRVFDPESMAETLQITPISQQSSNQRAGRAGRTQPGLVYRLYPETVYEGLPQSTTPEIQRSDLTSLILTLVSMGIDIATLDFMDPPSTENLSAGFLRCYSLGMVDADGKITGHGRDAVGFPLEPHYAKVLLAGNDEGYAEEVAGLLAMCTGQHSCFLRPRGKEEEADRAKKDFEDDTGDHLTMLTVYNEWVKSGKSVGWCQANFLNPRSMKACDDAKAQLLRLLIPHAKPQSPTPPHPHTLLRLLCTGLYDKTARLKPPHTYLTLSTSAAVHIHPSSTLFSSTQYEASAPQYILYNEVVHTTKEWVRTVSRISPKWLVEAVPQYFKRTDAEGLAMEMHEAKRRKTD